MNTFALIVTAENDRYYGFRLYCDILTGRVTVDADGKRATRKARKLCKVVAEKYGNVMSGTIAASSLCVLEGAFQNLSCCVAPNTGAQ